MTSCAKKEPKHTPYIPSIGDSVDLVYSKITGPYFSYDFGETGEIFGYLYLPSEHRFSGFGQGMIDESRPDVQVFLIHFENNVIKDILILDGHVTDELLDGGGREIFEDRQQSK